MPFRAAGRAGEAQVRWAAAEMLHVNATDLAFEFVRRVRKGELEVVAEIKMVIDERPEVAWEVILRVIDAAPEDSVLGALGAGPLEDLLWAHGPGFIDRVEHESATRPGLRHLLAGIYRGDIDQATWARIIALAEP